MDERGLARAGRTVEEVTATVRDATLGVPFLAREEVLCIAHDQLDDAGVKNDGLHGALVLRRH